MSGRRDLSAFGTISRNAIWLLAGRLGAQAFAALFTVVLARRLGPAGFGGYAFVTAAVFLANVVTTFGTDMVLIRDAAARRPRRWDAALAVQLGLSVVAIAAVSLLAPLADAISRDVGDGLRIYSVSLVPAAFFSVATAVLRGDGRMASYAGLGVFAASLQLAVLLLLGPARSLETVLAALLGVQAAVAIVAWAICTARIPSFRRLPRPSPRDVGEMLRATGAMGLLGLLGVAYQRVPVLVLTALAGPLATGWFAGATRIVEASKSGHVALFGAAYPGMAEAHASGGRPKDAASVERLAFGSAVALSAGLFAVSPLAGRFLFGPSFAPSAPGLAILALAILPSTFATYQSLDLVAQHRERTTLRAQLASLVTLAGMLAILVPLLGWTGGSWSVLGAEVVQAGLLMRATRGSRSTLARATRMAAAGSDM